MDVVFSDSPPEWTNMIKDSTLCGFFYIFFIIFSVIAAISLLMILWIFFGSKMSGAYLFSAVLNVMLNVGISGTAALFLYLICERSLHTQKQSNSQRMM